jgi:hypothetical protein
MSNNSDPAHERYAEMNLSDAKPVKGIPGLASLQAEHAQEHVLTLPLGNALHKRLKACAERSGDDYDTIVLDALARYLEGETLAQVVRRTIREELQHHD